MISNTKKVKYEQLNVMREQQSRYFQIKQTSFLAFPVCKEKSGLLCHHTRVSIGHNNFREMLQVFMKLRMKILSQKV
jgi:hypothetical protein